MEPLSPMVDPLPVSPLPVSIIIPTFNEVDSIGHVLREFPSRYRTDLIVADGGSTDGTQDVARAAGARVIDAGRGYGRACAIGAAAAIPTSRVIVFLDGDGADRGDLIGEIADPVLAGTKDLVLATRTLGPRDPGAMNWHQVLAGRIAGFGMGVLYGTRYSDMCAFRAISRTALEQLAMREMTYGWNIEMQMKAARANLRITEIPLPYRRRIGGQSKVAGSLRGTFKAGTRIVSTFVRVATAKT